MVRRVWDDARDSFYFGGQDVFAEMNEGFGGINRLSRPSTILVQTRFNARSYRDSSFTKDKQIICKKKMMNG